MRTDGWARDVLVGVLAMGCTSLVVSGGVPTQGEPAEALERATAVGPTAGPARPGNCAPWSTVQPLLGLAEGATRITARVEADRRVLFGDPRPFPADIPPALAAGGLEQAVLAALGDDFTATVTEVDCSEYPCVVALELPDIDEAVDAWEQLKGGLGVSASSPVAISGSSDDGAGHLVLAMAPGLDEPSLQRRTAERVSDADRRILR